MLGKIGFSCQKYITKLSCYSRKNNQGEEVTLLQKKVTQLKTEYNHTANLELEKGREIQRSFLPEQLPKIDNWEIVAHFDPARTVSGDFYDVFELPGDYLGLVIADVCDKGVGAALFMGLFRSLIRIFSGQTALQGMHLREVEIAELASREIGSLFFLDGIENIKDLNQINALKAVPLTNNYIAKNHGSLHMFATLFFGVLNPQTGCLSYINAGHESPLVLNKNGVKTTLKSTGTIVGVLPDTKFGVNQVYLDINDILISYTDGVTDARSPQGDFFTREKFQQLVEEPVSCLPSLLERIESSLLSHIQDAPQFDDITMLAIKRQLRTENIS